MTTLLSVDEVVNQGLIPSHDEIALSLYSDVVLPAEKAATEADNSNNTMFSRIAGYLLLYPPSEDARAVLKREIEHCKHENDQSQAIYDLGEMYFRDFIQVFFRTGTGETASSDSEDFDESPKPPNCYALLMAHIPGRSDTTPPAPNYSHAKAAALARDSFCCLLSGKPDVRSFWQGFLTEKPPGKEFVMAECCYIFPDSLGDPETDKIDAMTTHLEKDQMKAFWAILKRFGYTQVYDELVADTPEANLRRMENVMTLDSMIHEGFDQMFIWLEEVPGERNVYHVRLAGPMAHGNWGIPQGTVRFTAHTGDPLPSPVYLRIHAACCRVANMSGAAEYLNAMADEKEEAEALSEVSSAEIPSYVPLDRERSGSP